MLEQILNHVAQQTERPTKGEGACRHKPRLVGMRSKQLHRLMGKVTIERAYYHCVVEQGEQSTECRHDQAPYDAVWGPFLGRTSPGVQKCLGRLVSRLTLSKAVETFTSILSLPMSERQTLNLIQPVGEALRKQEEEQVETLFEQAANKQTQAAEQSSLLGPAIRRLSIETDGVTAASVGEA
jgi:hypothetical protein